MSAYEELARIIEALRAENSELYRRADALATQARLDKRERDEWESNAEDAEQRCEAAEHKRDALQSEVERLQEELTAQRIVTEVTQYERDEARREWDALQDRIDAALGVSVRSVKSTRLCGQTTGHSQVVYEKGEYPRCECGAVLIRDRWVTDA